MQNDELVARLAAHRTIGQAPRTELAWIATHGTLRQYQPGEVVSRSTEVVKEFLIILSGRLSHIVFRENGTRKVMEWRGGDVTGLLPYSRLTTPPGDTVIDELTEAVVLPREDLPALIHHCPEVTANLVHEMTDRARRFTSVDLRDEKMISLGKLAAGLAHELNNPASAAMRDAQSLVQALAAAEASARTLGAACLTEGQRAELDEVYALLLDTRVDRPLSGLALADYEEAVADWLRAHDVDADIAEELARIPITTELLGRLALTLQGKTLDAALRWLTAGCVARLLAANIERAAGRIHALVAAVKGFTHMDRAADHGPVDISAGLTDSVALLAGKARAKSVAITLDIAPALPAVLGLHAEINQIWMNLIDNAIDAAPVNGHVTVTATHEDAGVVVRVVDNGPGIPSEIKENIFDPFFTTKPVGKGTGLGLDIARRIVNWHNGEIEVASAPERTEFLVRMPALS
jgi:signal transduction histidine kinase